MNKTGRSGSRGPELDAPIDQQATSPCKTAAMSSGGPEKGQQLVPFIATTCSLTWITS
jgi:hypothetical protein